VRLYRRSIKKKETLRAVLRMLPPLAGRRCLELGCGTGIASWVLQRQGGDWIRAESDAAQLAAAQRLLGGGRAVRLGDGDLPFADASFDLVVAVNVLRHHKDDLALLREVARVVKPAGRLVATAPEGPSHRLGYRLRRAYGFTADRLSAYGDLRDGYEPEGLKSLVRAAGLDPERLETYSRLFTELVENTLLFAYYRALRNRPEVAERHPAGTWTVSDGSLTPRGWRFRLYGLAYPFLRGVSLLDRLIPFRPGYMFCLGARRPPLRGAAAR
jgi:SAM-dependent methyltransferase